MTALTFNVQPLAAILDAGALTRDGSLVEQIYELLRRLIVNLSVPPESALVEQEVASVLNVSKTPVREAIIRLSREGLVQVVPKSPNDCPGRELATKEPVHDQRCAGVPVRIYVCFQVRGFRYFTAEMMIDVENSVSSLKERQ